MEFSNTMRDHLQFMCHLRMVDNQAFTKRRMSSDLIINAPPFLYLRQSNRLAFLFSPTRLALKNSPMECPESYRPHQNLLKPTAIPIRNTGNRHLNDTEQQERFHFYNTSRKMK